MSMTLHLQPTDNTAIHQGDQQLSLDQADVSKSLIDAIRHLLSQQGCPIDNIRLNDVVHQHTSLSHSELEDVVAVLKGIGIKDMPEILEQPDAAFLP